ncbi:MAG TPA: FHA domain-containing protein [Anaerolineales bacterium]|nr:FHA domain-containing protein [Anaerolineales bacterium]
MIICSNCQHENVSGTLFCVECGTQLDGVDTLTTQAITQDQIAEDLKGKSANVEPPSSPANSWISLHLMDSGKILPLASRTEFTMGRLSEGQPIMPDIDLTPYQAYASGVSRLHVVVKREAERTVVMDLGSSNGTYLNGRRLNPHTEEELKHGDVVALGKLKIQVLLRNA